MAFMLEPPPETNTASFAGAFWVSLYSFGGAPWPAIDTTASRPRRPWLQTASMVDCQLLEGAGGASRDLPLVEQGPAVLSTGALAALLACLLAPAKLVRCCSMAIAARDGARDSHATR